MGILRTAFSLLHILWDYLILKIYNKFYASTSVELRKFLTVFGRYSTVIYSALIRETMATVSHITSHHDQSIFKFFSNKGLYLTIPCISYHSSFNITKWRKSPYSINYSNNFWNIHTINCKDFILNQLELKHKC